MAGKTLYEALAAIRPTPVSSDLPAPSVLLQGRHLRGKLPFIQSRLTPQFIPAPFVLKQLQHRQATTCCQHGGRPDVRGLVLTVGQRVRVLVTGLWRPVLVETVCTAPESYVVRLTDGRVFRRTRRDINVDKAALTVTPAAPPVATRPMLPQLAWQTPVSGPDRPVVPRRPAVPQVPPSAEPLPLPPAPTRTPSRRGRPPKMSPALPQFALQPIAPPADGTPSTGSTRSGRPYLKS